MDDTVKAFVKYWQDWEYDIKNILERELEALKDGLSSDDEHIRELADNQVSEILDWLYPRSNPESRQQREARIEKRMKAAPGITAGQARAWAPGAARSTGKRRGRPRTAGQDAIHALTLRLTTKKSWREIALEVRGCVHVCSVCGRRKTKCFEGRNDKRRPQPRCPNCGLTRRVKSENKSCYACGDALRNSVSHFETFLHRKALHPIAPASTKRSFPPPD